jgi:hypothetical protein
MSLQHARIDLASAAVEPFTQRTQILTLRNHETLQARDGLPQILVFVRRLQGGISRAHESSACQRNLLARCDEVLYRFFQAFEHGTEGTSHVVLFDWLPSSCTEPIETGRDGRIRTGDLLTPSQAR